MSTAYLFVGRFLVFSSVAAALYFVIGCCMYGQWWFRFVWDKQFIDREFITDAFGFLLNDRFYLLLGAVVAVLVGGWLTWTYKPVFAFVDKFRALLLFCSFASVVVTALVLYQVERDSYPFALQGDADDVLKQSLQVMERTMQGIQGSTAPPPLKPPIDFHYLDKQRIDVLFSQIQSTLVEKERTVNTTGNVRGKVGAAAGPLTAEAEAGKSASSTSSFSRPDFSSERKGIEVINYLIEHNTPQYYKTREEWLLRRANADFWIEWQQSQLFPKLINSSAVDRIAPLTGKVSKEEREDIERKAERYEAYLMDGLRSSGFVVVDGTFSVHAVGNNINLLEHFSAKPTVVFRAELPKSAMDGVLREGRTHLTMFGNVIKTLDNEGYVDLRPIALY